MWASDRLGGGEKANVAVVDNFSERSCAEGATELTCRKRRRAKVLPCDLRPTGSGQRPHLELVEEHLRIRLRPEPDAPHRRRVEVAFVTPHAVELDHQVPSLDRGLFGVRG